MRSPRIRQLKTYLTDVRAKLEKGLRIAKAAEICAASGRTRKGMEIALSLGSIVYELNTHNIQRARGPRPARPWYACAAAHQSVLGTESIVPPPGAYAMSSQTIVNCLSVRASMVIALAILGLVVVVVVALIPDTVPWFRAGMLVSVAAAQGQWMDAALLCQSQSCSRAQGHA